MNIIGTIEAIDENEVHGWAFITDAPDDHLVITLSLDDLAIGSGIANITRDDLATIGFGNGDHAFAVTFDIPVRPEDLDHIEVFAQAPNGDRLRLARNRGKPVVAEPPPPPSPVALGSFPLPTHDRAQHPVFVLGAARSGTSAMAQALLKCGVYQGFEEGHFLWLLRNFLLTVHKYYEANGEDALPDRFTMLSRVPKTYLIGAARAVFIAAMSEMFPQGRWIDKTPRPEMIEAAPLMQELWPNARFVFMKRRGLENVSSRLTKFPTIDFADHCRDWARSMEAWLIVRDLMGGAAMEVEQLAVAREPERTATEVGKFLDLPDYATRRIAIAFANDRPEQTTRKLAPILQIDKLGWTDLQIVAFREICGPMMAAYGYAYTDAYFAPPMIAITTSRVAEE